MYWYPFSQQEEERAWDQAEAQIKTQEGQAAKKQIGNLGEIAFEQYLEEYASNRWKYINERAINKQEAEYHTNDFKIGASNLTVDVKSTTDIRKFDPVSMYFEEGVASMPGSGREGYPKVNVDNSEIFVFIYISHARDTTPDSEMYSFNEDEMSDMPTAVRDHIKGSSGNRIAALLGWTYAREFYWEVVSGMNQGSRGKFTRMAIRDLHELLYRADALG